MNLSHSPRIFIHDNGQGFDVLHRSGNVHDSNGAAAFLIACIEYLREALPGVVIEVRADSAFFSDEIVTILRGQRVEFTLSVPFAQQFCCKENGMTFLQGMQTFNIYNRQKE